MRWRIRRRTGKPSSITKVTSYRALLLLHTKYRSFHEFSNVREDVGFILICLSLMDSNEIDKKKTTLAAAFWKAPFVYSPILAQMMSIIRIVWCTDLCVSRAAIVRPRFWLDLVPIGLMKTAQRNKKELWTLSEEKRIDVHSLIPSSYRIGGGRRGRKKIGKCWGVVGRLSVTGRFYMTIPYR